MVKPVHYTEVSGGSFIGQIDFTYAELVSWLGEPNAPTDGYKTDVEWAVEVEDGTGLSIYNYKDGDNYNHDGTRNEDLTNWHIGSAVQDPTLVDKLLNELFELSQKS